MKSPLKTILAIFCLSLLFTPQAFTQQGSDNNNTFTLVSKDIAVADIIGMIARSARINLLFGKEVHGTMSVNFDKVPATEALENICTANDLVILEFSQIDRISLIVHKSRAAECRELIKGANSDADSKQGQTSFVNRQVAIEDVLMMIARFAKLDIIFTGQAKEKARNTKMGVELRGVSPIRAINAICIMNELEVIESTGSNGKKTLTIR